MFHVFDIAKKVFKPKPVQNKTKPKKSLGHLYKMIFHKKLLENLGFTSRHA
jgi:hypothetical protein